TARLYFLFEPANTFVARNDVSLIHVIRLAALIAGTNDFQFRHLFSQLVTKHYFSRATRFSLCDIAATLTAAGRDDEEVARAMLDWPNAVGAFLKFDAGDVWPYFAEHPQLLEQAWQAKPAYAFQEHLRQSTLFTILGTFPSLPP